MPWQNQHLHQFEADGVIYGTNSPESNTKVVSEARTRLPQVLRKPTDRLIYAYDFGDGWRHSVVLEKILPDIPDGQFPLITAGRGACPPEDVGGIGGYYRFLQILADPKHPEHREMLEWADGPFDPDAFDVRKANFAIHGGWVIEDELE